MSELHAWLAAPFAPEHRFLWRALLMCALLGASASLLGTDPL